MSAREREITDALIAWCRRREVEVGLEALQDLIDLVRRLSDDRHS